MSKVLIIKGSAKRHRTGGVLTCSFVDLASEVLNSLGHQVAETGVDRDCDFSVEE